MNSYTKSSVAGTTSTKSKLMLTAAAGALLCLAATPAYALCSYDGAPGHTITCDAATPGSASDPGISGITLDPFLNMNVNTGAQVGGGTSFQFGAGTTPGPFGLNVQQTDGDTTNLNVAVYAWGTPTVAANTAAAINAGHMTDLVLQGFGGAISVTNSNVMNALYATGAGGATLHNTGTIGGTYNSYGVYIDTLYTDPAPVPTARTYDTTTKRSTGGLDSYTYTHRNQGGDVSIVNSGTINYDLQARSANASFTNSGTMVGTVTMVAANAHGPNYTDTFLETYLDTGVADVGAGVRDDSNSNGVPDYYTSTDTIASHAWGGNVTAANTGNIEDGIRIVASGTIGLANTGTTGVIDNGVNLSTVRAYAWEPTVTPPSPDSFSEYDDAIGDYSEVTVETITDDARKPTDVSNTSDITTVTESFTPTGGAITATNSGTIHGYFAAFGAGNVSLDNSKTITGFDGGEGPYDGMVIVNSSITADESTYTTTQNDKITPASDTHATPVVSPADPPNTTTNVETVVDFDWAHSHDSGETHTYTSVGGTATLTNETGGVIGTANAELVGVEIDGDAGAIGTNAGTIHGYVDVTSDPGVFQTASDTGGSNYESLKTVITTVETNDGTHDPYISSLTVVGTEKDGTADQRSGSGSMTYSSGDSATDASYTNSGTTDGEVSVEATGEASVANTGTIKGGIDIGNTVNYAWDWSRSSSNTHENVTTNIEQFSTTSDLTSDHLTSDDVTTTEDQHGGSHTSSSNGGTAVLTNGTGGVIGAQASLVNVEVVGQAAGTINNDGTIWGDVTVRATEFASARDHSSSNTETVETKTDETNTYNTNGDATHSTSSTDDTHSGTSESSSSRSRTYSGGVAALTNTSSKSIHGAVTVSGIESATLDNTGLITGDATITALRTASDRTRSNTTTGSRHTTLDTTTDNTYDSTSHRATAVVVDTVGTLTANIETTSDYSNTETKAGGDATLTNGAGGVIGVKAEPVEIDITGADSATADNAGKLYASVYLDAQNTDSDTFTSNGTTTANATGNYETTDTKNYVIATDTSSDTPVYHQLLNTESVTTTVNSVFSAAATLDNVETVVATAGDASFVNEATGIVGDPSANGYVSVSANADASLDNAGSIYGDVSVHGGGYNSDTELHTTSGSQNTLTASQTTDTTYTVDSKLFTSTLATETWHGEGTTSNSWYETSDQLTQYAYTGGSATLTNEADAVITGGATVGSNAAADLSNSGEIDGSIGVWGSSYSYSNEEVVNNSGSGTTAGTATITYDERLVTDPTTAAFYDSDMSDYPLIPDIRGATSLNDTNNYETTYSYSNEETNSALKTAGTASLENKATGVLGGETIYVEGVTSATLVNAGSIVPTEVVVSAAMMDGGECTTGICVKALGYDSESHHTSTDVGSDAGMASITATVAPTFDSKSGSLLTLTADATTHSTYTNVETTTDSWTRSYTYTGGDATLTNQTGGTIGSDTSRMDVTVIGLGQDTSAVVNNGKIYGDLTIGAIFTDTASTGDHTVTSNYENVTDGTYHSVLTNTYDTDGTTLLHSTIVTDTTGTLTESQNRVDSEAYSSTKTDVGSHVSYTGTGDLYGGLAMTSVYDVALTNTGWIGNKIDGGETISLISTGDSKVKHYTSVVTSTMTNSETLVGHKGASDSSVKAVSDTGTMHTNVDTVRHADSSTTPIGGKASLINTNTGTIGGYINNGADIIVAGPGGATAQNSGTINGSLWIRSADRSKTHVWDYHSNVDTVTNYENVSGAYDSVELNTVNWSASSNHTWVGGLGLLTNTSTITGDGNVMGVQGASATNTGKIYGNLSVYSGQDVPPPGDESMVGGVGLDAMYVDGGHYSDGPYYNSTSSTAFTQNIETTINYTDADNNSTSIVTTEGTDTLHTYASTGGDASVTNTGSIGLYTNDLHGIITILGGNVDVYANGNATFSNTHSGIVYGNVEMTSWGESDSHHVVDAFNSTVSTVFAKGDRTYTLNSTDTVTTDESWTHGGGTATFTNAGQIGKSFASTDGTVTDVGGVSISGTKGATATNTATGLIGGGLSAESNAVDNVHHRVFVTTNDVLESDTATDTSTTTHTLTETWTDTRVGGSAAITNAGSIGVNILDDLRNKRPSEAEVIANGDAGASIVNTGTIQGEEVAAVSLTSNYSDVVHSTDSVYLEDGLLKASSLNSTETSTYTPVGGRADITNSGTIQADAVGGYEMATFEMGGGNMDVTAIGYAGASIVNTGTIDTRNGVYTYGTVGAYSDATTNVVTTTDVESANDYGLIDSVKTRTETHTYSGGTGLVNNSATIDGDVVGEGFTAGTVINSGSISNDVTATSAPVALPSDNPLFWNYSLTATNHLTGPTSSVIDDSFVETWSATGGDASVTNSGSIGGAVTIDGFKSAVLSNTGSVGGAVEVDSEFVNQTDTSGVVTVGPHVGGSASLTNSGSITGEFVVESITGSTLTNAATAKIDTCGCDSKMSTYSLDGHNTFSNAGISGALDAEAVLSVVLGAATGIQIGNPGNVSFIGNTTAVNTGILASDISFSNSGAGASAATFTFGKGSILVGNISSSASSLGLTFTDSGLYTGNISGATTTTKTGSGRWILTGTSLGLGTTSINAGTVEFGLATNYFLRDTDGLLAALGQYGLNLDWNVLQEIDVLKGNTAISDNLSLAAQLLSLLRSPTVITGNMSIASGATVEGEGHIVGNVTNAGTLIPGWMLADNPMNPLSNMLDNANIVLPSEFVITGNYSQTSTGTLVTNIDGAITRYADTTVSGTQSDLFAQSKYWLDVAPFTADNSTSTHVTVNGDTTTVAGRVLVYVDKRGLYVDGDTTEILSTSGALTSTATTAQTQSSLFVGFGLATATSGANHVLNVTVDRTSYASVAASANQTNIGHALDSAVSDVAAQITADAFSSVAHYSDVEDMAGFLNNMDWYVTTQAQAQQILAGLSPEGYANLSALDTGQGYRGLVRNHLTRFDPNSDFGVWGQGYVVSQSISGRDGIEGLAGTTTGATMGFDMGFDNVLVGIAGGYARTNFDTASRNFNGAETTFQVGAYGKATFDDLYIDAAAWGNFGTGSTVRNLDLGDRVVNASFSPTEIRFDVGAGYRFATTLGVTVTPYVDLSYRNLSIDDITEAGAGGLGVVVSNLGGSFFKPSLGVTVDGEWAISTTVKARPMVGIGIEFQSKADDVTAQFLGGGDAFAVKSAYGNSVAAKPEAGVDFVIGEHLSMQLGYMGSLGSNGQTHGGWIGVRGNW